MVVVNLSGVDITKDVFQSLITGARKLKVLTLCYNTSIHGTPTFPWNSRLEKLTISKFFSLKEIDCSIGKLLELTDLSFECCVELEKLPEQIGELRKLQHLSLRSCDSLRELPAAVLKLTSLMKLDVVGTRITRLPDSIDRLSSLLSINVSFTSIEKLPSAMSKLLCLQTLHLNNCDQIQELPELPRSLTTLQWTSTSLVTVPNLSYLTNLVELALSDDTESVAKSDIIRTCDMQWIESLSRLRKLQFCFSNVCVSTIELGSLSLLEELTLHGVDVPAFKQLPSELIVLELYDTREKQIRHPPLEKETAIVSSSSRESEQSKVLRQMKIKFIEDHKSSEGWVHLRDEPGCNDLQAPELIDHWRGDFHFPSSINTLRKLVLWGCPGVRDIQFVPTPLSIFSVGGCTSLKRLGGLSNLKYLSELTLNRCWSLEVVEGIDELKFLHRLKIDRCESVEMILDPLSSKIPDECSIEITRSGKLPDTGRTSNTWESYREKILNGTETETTDSEPDSEIEIRDPSLHHDSSYVTTEGFWIPQQGSSLFTLEKSETGGDAPLHLSSMVTIPDWSSRFGRSDSETETELPTKKKRKTETEERSMEKMNDEARQQVADMENSENKYAIAAVQNVVGLDDGVKQITDLLEMEVNDETCIIGIYGIDGIGKTTLAKAVYDRISSCFESCSFLAEVEETAQNPSGIQFLQTKLIRDILGRSDEDPSFDERIEDFLHIFREMKVLIVIDDVEKQSYLHAIVGDLCWFGLGSRIIVTSQNEEILKEYDPEKAHTYMVGKLDDDKAFELFCQHAFGKKSPIPGYDGHANCIVNATEKLPLAIEVIGSSLRGKPIGEWKKMEESIKRFISSSQKTTVCFAKILDICYEGLDPKQKHIFLDIACFISGVDVQIASYMWPCSHLPSSDCILMPLAKIGENNELQMHRLLRCVGRRILNQKGSGDPTQRKFYMPDMVPKSVSRDKGMENVEALCIDLDDHGSCKFTAGDFESSPDKTFLKLDNAKDLGDFTGAFPSVKWLCWQRCPLDFNAENIVLRELVVLDLSWSKVTEDWRGWSEIKMEKLKVLNLTQCSDLLSTPDFSGCTDLEILILERCSRLEKLDPSISHLKCLVSLNLKFCSYLDRLPVELACMTALKELSIDETSIRQIPSSIGNLKQLEILSGFKCPLTYLPSSISYLSVLSKISLDGAKINELPISLGELSNLRLLSLRGCLGVEELPDSIGKMGSLEELDISATSISNLPNSMRNLRSLRVLRMDSTFIRAFPEEIGNLTKLEELHASRCWSLKGAIPSDIGGLRHLRSLTLGHSSISSLPPEISTISSLHALDLLHCNEIEELPKLPPSLICLHVSSNRMKAIPLLEDLKELEELFLSDGEPEAHQPPSKQPMPESNMNGMIDKQSFSIFFPKLRKLALSLSQVIKLKFELTDMSSIKRLKTLTLPGSSGQEVSELPKTLSVFKLFRSAIEEIEGLEGLEALKRLDISNCKMKNLNGLGQLASLRSLILSDCDYLNLPDLSNLKSLKVLEIRRCKMIRQIEGLEKLTSLEKLYISECPAENAVQVQKALKLQKALRREIELVDSET
ncbi:hypothetical protein BT93_G0723 [Corymbia citriodora subsp. variegata]|nr:hypothetical protein BT93_G0723 [Corymbia citriodora subsp. variegata]